MTQIENLTRQISCLSEADKDELESLICLLNEDGQDESLGNFPLIGRELRDALGEQLRARINRRCLYLRHDQSDEG